MASSVFDNRSCGLHPNRKAAGIGIVYVAGLFRNSDWSPIWTILRWKLSLFCISSRKAVIQYVFIFHGMLYNQIRKAYVVNSVIEVNVLKNGGTDPFSFECSFHILDFIIMAQFGCISVLSWLHDKTLFSAYCYWWVVRSSYCLLKTTIKLQLTRITV
jgi:hypothetical protein